ncbi:MAG: hypothetical protein LBL60_00725 [Mycoplasmataceae bacterium]|nr:hypothetical protein [Mycoplasmataceae bacterium]
MKNRNSFVSKTLHYPYQGEFKKTAKKAKVFRILKNVFLPISILITLCGLTLLLVAAAPFFIILFDLIAWMLLIASVFGIIIVLVSDKGVPDWLKFNPKIHLVRLTLPAIIMIVVGVLMLIAAIVFVCLYKNYFNKVVVEYRAKTNS